MDQSNIYDFLGIESDPLFNKISKLKKGQRISMGNIKILLNEFGIYELITTDEHEGFSSMLSCYKSVNELCFKGGVMNG